MPSARRLTSRAREPSLRARPAWALPMVPETPVAPTSRRAGWSWSTWLSRSWSWGRATPAREPVGVSSKVQGLPSTGATWIASAARPSNRASRTWRRWAACCWLVIAASSRLGLQLWAPSTLRLTLVGSRPSLRIREKRCTGVTRRLATATEALLPWKSTWKTLLPSA